MLVFSMPSTWPSTCGSVSFSSSPSEGIMLHALTRAAIRDANSLATSSILFFSLQPLRWITCSTTATLKSAKRRKRCSVAIVDDSNAERKRVIIPLACIAFSIFSFFMMLVTSDFWKCLQTLFSVTEVSDLACVNSKAATNSAGIVDGFTGRSNNHLKKEPGTMWVGSTKRLESSESSWINEPLGRPPHLRTKSAMSETSPGRGGCDLITFFLISDMFGEGHASFMWFVILRSMLCQFSPMAT